MQEVQSDIRKQLKRLEYIEDTLGVCTRPFIKLRTRRVLDKRVYKHLTKTEIYDVNWFEDKSCDKQIEDANSALEGKKIEVWREHVEYDALGRMLRNVYTWEDKYKEFDTLEEARQWIWDNDESRTECGEGSSFFDGYHYFIKIPEIDKS